MNISFEPEFGNPRFETPKKLNVFNFQLTCFSAIVDFIIWFCTSLSSAEKPGVLNLFLSHLFFMLSSKRGFSNPAFQNSGSNPTWFRKPEKIPFQTKKGHFCFNLKGPLFVLLFYIPNSWVHTNYIAYVSEVILRMFKLYVHSMYYKSECKEDQKLHLTLRKKGKKPLWQAIRAAWHTRRHHIQLQTFIVPSPYSPVSLVSYQLASCS